MAFLAAKMLGGEKVNGMKTLVIANQKGGVGKTSTLVHLAFYLQEKGKRVIVIDLDTQGNASYTLASFARGMSSSALFFSPEAKMPVARPALSLVPADTRLMGVEALTRSEAQNRLSRCFRALAEQGYDACLVDTAPALGIRMSAALACADFVLSPIELEVYSMQGIKMMLTTIFNIRKECNPGLSFLGMLPSRVDSRNPRHKKHLEELTQTYPKLLTPVSIGLRSSIANALAAQIPVWSVRKTAARSAAREFRALGKYVREKLYPGETQ